MSVADMRRAAVVLARRPDALDALESMAGSALPADRMTAGYALSAVVQDFPDRARSIATRLAQDDAWEVREAATFGIRDSSLTVPDVVANVLQSWSESDSSRLHRAVLVVARQPKRQKREFVVHALRCMERALHDDDAYVRKNIPFAVRYLARNQPGLTSERAPHWASSTIWGWQLAALAAVRSGRLDGPLAQALCDDLSRSRIGTVRRAADRLLHAMG